VLRGILGKTHSLISQELLNRDHRRPPDSPPKLAIPERDPRDCLCVSIVRAKLRLTALEMGGSWQTKVVTVAGGRCAEVSEEA
jgi:hypothetical protein